MENTHIMNTRQLVLPSGPTVLGSRRSYRLSKNDLLINFTVSELNFHASPTFLRLHLLTMTLWSR